MESIPEDFPQIYRRIIEEPNVGMQKKLCYEAICMIQQFLEAQSSLNEEVKKNNADFQMLADWYATWLRIRHYAKMNDAVKVYMWGIMLQQELNSVCAEFGLKKCGLWSIIMWEIWQNLLIIPINWNVQCEQSLWRAAELFTHTTILRNFFMKYLRYNMKCNKVEK